MTDKMSYVHIIGLKACMRETIQVLGRLGCMHIDTVNQLQHDPVSLMTIDPALVRRQEELSRQLLQVNGILDILQIHVRRVAASVFEGESAESCLAKVTDVVQHIQRLVTERDALQAENELLPRYEQTMRKLLPIFPEAAHDPANVSFGLLLTGNHSEIVGIIKAHVGDMAQGTAETAVGSIDATTQAMLITVPKSYAEPVSEMLDQHDVARVRLPPGFDSSSPESAMTSLRHRLRTIQERCTAIEHELKRMTEQWQPILLWGWAILHDELQVYDVMARTGETEQTFLLVGWVPCRKFNDLNTALHSALGNQIIVTEQAVTPELRPHAPVALTNPALAQPFEGLVHLFSTPQYDGIDPTRLMALFMPIFFGMMLGDIGYGALLLVLTGRLRRRFVPGMARDILTILALGSGWAIVFGILFGELFGTLGEEVGLHPLLFDRTSSEHLVDLLMLTLSVGAVHIVLGLLLGLWESIRQRNKHHLFERSGRLLGLMALFLLAGVLADFLPAGFMTPALALLLVGTVLLAASLGKIGLVMAPIEMIGLVGQILSYLRIAAIGLASVYLALVASELAGTMGSIIVGAIIAILLHALNLVLGAFSPTIQSLRLHYVEFFRNFYEGGGRVYQPFHSYLSTPQ